MRSAVFSEVASNASRLPPAGVASQGLHAGLGYARFRSQMAALTGAAPAPDRQYFVESRLAPILRAHNLADLLELASAIDARESQALVDEVIDALIDNETSFFRDHVVFEEFVGRVLPELMKARSEVRRLRIWCAAVSTGQEAYSLAMALDHEARALRGWTVEVLATDISGAAIEAARSGVYSQFEVQRGLSTSRLLRYFHRHEDNWRVNEHLRAWVSFERFNLMSDPGDFGTFDAIFCRNALLRFEPRRKQETLARLGRALAPDGFLFLGASESLGEDCENYAAASGDGIWRPRARRRPRLALV
ncbi:CheR family methyltransferase [Methylocystis heyeri]|uniref:protein-glutamate O-methyltransferase n=1 Tax=Methylocystis heyeri TaxID=391905 RepID=A0A6B8KJF1_9HYPH|nr:protein-glutamate O-methyltransferase CheR [Methylocystis heyeri]QGM47812.1 chemotaxis protein CheR [Methylocystis heyeri]